jgi:uncharacterized protein (TIGR03435 family)
MSYPKLSAASLLICPSSTARRMLREMLAERFGLKLHQEHKEIPVYALVAGSAGLKLHGDSHLGTYSDQKPGSFVASGISMRRFARVLTKNADLPVIDMTGLDGTYQIHLKWAAELKDNPGGVVGRGDVGILTALEQLGLKLEKRQMSVSVLVIDHVDRTPSGK